jgi:hypothetical protein
MRSGAKKKEPDKGEEKLQRAGVEKCDETDLKPSAPAAPRHAHLPHPKAKACCLFWPSQRVTKWLHLPEILGVLHSHSFPYSLSTASLDSTRRPLNSLVASRSFQVAKDWCFVPSWLRLQFVLKPVSSSKGLHNPVVQLEAIVACMDDNLDELFSDEGINAAIAATFDTDALSQRIERSHIVGCCQ